MRTTFPEENGDLSAATKDSPNISGHPQGESEEGVSFPKKLRHNGRGKVLARIYKRPGQQQPYRLYWRSRVDGKPRSMFKDFGTYSEAKRQGDKVVAGLAKGSQASALSPGQVSDTLAALQRLQSHYEVTGRRMSLLAAVSISCEAAAKLNGRTIGEAIDGFLASVATVKRVNVSTAVEEFLTAEAPRAQASNGQRAQVSAKYAYNRAIMLRRFASCFPGTAVADLGKAHLDTFFAELDKLPTKSRNKKHATSAKIRNHHRAAVRQFLAWAVRKDYLSTTHRLGEADGLRPERANTSETEFYTPIEFKALLDAAQESMRALIAIGGLAGLRTAELLRLTWEDTRRVEGHIEITSGKSKTRQRRLVEIVPALAQWLEPFKEFTGKIWTGHEVTFQQHLCDICDKAKYETKPGHKATVQRKPNGLRHAFCTYHFAAHGNENLTAQQAGNSPGMIHQHYKGLATKKEGEAWFAVAPARPGNVIQLATAAKN